MSATTTTVGDGGNYRVPNYKDETFRAIFFSMAGELTPEQWEAARVIVARMLAEAVGTPFTYESVGLVRRDVEDYVFARTEAGVEIRMSDFNYAAMMLLWSALSEQADILEEDTPVAAIGRLGVALAGMFPASS